MEGLSRHPRWLEGLALAPRACSANTSRDTSARPSTAGQLRRSVQRLQVQVTESGCNSDAVHTALYGDCRRNPWGLAH